MDPFDLQRFVDAQSPVIDRVRTELRAGRKSTHWMWFIFPQIGGLGQSPMSVRFAITSQAEAAAYVAHPLLGPRLIETTQLVLGAAHRPICEIFGYPDDLKFHSSMTLFALAAPENSVFRQALDTFFSGGLDPATVNQWRTAR